MKKNTFNKIASLVLFLGAYIAGTLYASASVSNGTIDSSFKMTKICQDTTCTTFGNVNWKPTLNAMTPGALPVAITDTNITGHIWGDQIGWINLAPTGAGIFVNPSTGVVTGKAFASVGSWINFATTGQSVTLIDNGSGSDLSGWAWVSGAYGGWMKFDCGGTGTCIKTDWRTIPFRPTPPSGGGGGTVIINNNQPPTQNQPPQNNPNNQNPRPPQPNPPKNPKPTIFDNQPPNIVPKSPIFEEQYIEVERPKIPSVLNADEPTFKPPQDDGQYRERFPKTQVDIVPDKPCFWCILERYDTTNQTVENSKKDQAESQTYITYTKERSILKYGFVPQKLEIRIPLKKTKLDDFKKEKDIPDKDIDGTSVGITLLGGWALWKLLLVRAIKLLISKS